MTQHNRETLLALADQWTRGAIRQAGKILNLDPNTARNNAVEIAAMFEVAAALRATLDLTGEKA